MEVTAVEMETIAPVELTANGVWLLAMVTGAELAMVAWPLALTLLGEIETTSPFMAAVALAALVIETNRLELPLEMGQPTASN